jgi:hypothetical protein
LQLQKEFVPTNNLSEIGDVQQATCILNDLGKIASGETTRALFKE